MDDPLIIQRITYLKINPMKKSIVILIITLLNSIILFAQEIKPAPEDKAVVYFVRTSALGLAINFSYFDSTKVVGRFNGPKYIRYECSPGKHLFWARSENRDFVDAELEAGKIYFLWASPQMGLLKAGVELLPVDPKDESTMKKIIKLLTRRESESFTEQELLNDADSLKDAITRGMAKYAEDVKKGILHKTLNKSMFYNP
jgi:hypothetical protein